MVLLEMFPRMFFKMLPEMLLFVLVTGIIEQHRVAVAHILGLQLTLGLLAQEVSDAMVCIDRLDNRCLHQLDEIAYEATDQPHLHTGYIAGARQFRSNLLEKKVRFGERV